MLINHYGLERDGSAGADVPHAEHVGVSVQDGRGRRHRHEQTGNDLPLMIGKSQGIARFSAALPSASGCQQQRAASPAGTSGQLAARRLRPRWADSVLATLTLREKAAQMVWPSVYWRLHYQATRHNGSD